MSENGAVTISLGIAGQRDVVNISGFSDLIESVRSSGSAPQGILDILEAPDYYEMTVSAGISIGAGSASLPDIQDMSFLELLGRSMSGVVASGPVGPSPMGGIGVFDGNPFSVEPFAAVSFGVGFGVGATQGTDFELMVSNGHFSDLEGMSISVEASGLPTAISGGGMAVPLGAIPGEPGTTVYLMRSADPIPQASGAFEFEWTYLINGPRAVEIARQIADGELLIEQLTDTLEPTTEPPSCFGSGTRISMADHSEKAIEEIDFGDIVLSYDHRKELRRGRVIGKKTNYSKQILDMHGLIVTPGHVTLCVEGQFANEHVPIIDILRHDAAIMDVEGRRIRAATGCELGSSGDKFVLAVVGERKEDGTIVVRDAKSIRVGTRYVLEDGRDFSVLELIEASGGEIDDERYIFQRDTGQRQPFLWPFSGKLPDPEDYILQRSATTLEDIYRANEWEAVKPRTLAPASLLPNVEGERTVPINLPLSLQRRLAAANE